MQFRKGLSQVLHKILGFLTKCRQLDKLNNGAILGDVQEGDLALVLALVRGHHVLHLELGVRPVVVDHELAPEIER